MYMKFCHRCHNYSFSSFERDQSDCPNCSLSLESGKNYIAQATIKKDTKVKGRKKLTISLVKSKFDRGI
ncbi:hypothetical protein BACCIP111883_01499 [Sutcliffiella rhizosphaerae]|uniref:Uncharacterized protein n=1 Tax=Sutcliffiella rhizosphaerae TaxID=2880967 RepID=A0ABM8YL82_9BACI|nr:hypothetical protein BACCIP111883_01499 [Sutcliffiella rhizosphaerae]